MAVLQTIFHQLDTVENVRIESGSGPLCGGAAVHMMCHEPSGIRVALIVSAR